MILKNGRRKIMPKVVLGVLGLLILVGCATTGTVTTTYQSYPYWTGDKYVYVDLGDYYYRVDGVIYHHHNSRHVDVSVVTVPPHYRVIEGRIDFNHRWENNWRHREHVPPPPPPPRPPIHYPHHRIIDNDRPIHMSHPPITMPPPPPLRSRGDDEHGRHEIRPPHFRSPAIEPMRRPPISNTPPPRMSPPPRIDRQVPQIRPNPLGGHPSQHQRPPVGSRSGPIRRQH